MGSFIERHRGKLLALVSILGIAGLIWIDAHRPPPPAPVASGTAVPDLPLNVLGGNAVKLSDLRGKPAVLDFWATWCGPCRQSLPHLDELSKKYGGRAAFYAVDGDPNDSVRLISDTAKELGLTMPVVTNGAPLVGDLAIEAFPTTVIVGKDGRVAASFQGVTPMSEIARALDSQL